MDPDPAKREDEIADRVEDWIQKCDRLARHGAQYELATMYKTVVLGKILIGETKRAYESWKLEGLPFEKLLAKLKDYARSRRLDGEARQGKQAVDLNRSDIKEPAAWGG